MLSRMAIQAQISSRFVFGGCQDLLTENACGLNNLCFNRQQQESMHRIPKTIDDHHSISQIISAQIENQRIEIDHYINSQNERLRMALQEQRKQQTALLMKKYEWKIESLMKRKEEEMLKAANKKVELLECLRRMEMERQAWQRLAQENEATAASLNSTIQRLREAASSGAAEDAESCCLEREREEEREGGTWGEQETRKMVCRCCNSRNSCVIMLPCRHLCSCRDCDAFLDSCPVCNLPKKASLEALL